jgi:uncharacterized membrane protein
LGRIKPQAKQAVAIQGAAMLLGARAFDQGVTGSIRIGRRCEHRRQTRPTRRRPSMPSTVHVSLRRWLWLTMAGAVLLTGLTTSTAAALVAAPAGATPQPPAPAAPGQPASPPSAGLGLAASRQAPSTSDPNGAFLRSRHGRFTPLGGIPGAAVSSHLNVNNRGQVVGAYADGQGTLRAFVKDRRGRVTTFAVPGAAATLAAGINDRGQVAGTYFDTLDPPPPPPGTVHGFVRQPDGQITTIDLPARTLTAVTDINNHGQLAGQTLDAAGRAIGFVRDPNGRVTTIDIPGREVGDVPALNDRGQVVGEAAVPPDALSGNPTLKPRYGFVWDRGRISQLDVPRSLATVAYGINNAGQITGAYADAAGRRHGFLLQRGRYSTIDAPGRPETEAAWGINDRGQIVIPELGTGLGPVPS